MFIVTELLKQNLYEVSRVHQELGREPYFTLARIQSIMRQVLTAMEFIHSLRLIHSDLKPENILLKTKYIPGKPIPLIKLADFGLSTQKIIMETIAGTKEYIAPEQAKFHNYTNAVDVWSLGIILDEVLHGTPFYSG